MSYQDQGQRNGNYNNQQQGAPRKEAKLEIDSIPFDGEIRTKRTTTINFGKQINGIFRNAMPDYYGCTFSVSTRGDLLVNLYFVDTGKPQKGTIKVLKDLRHFDSRNPVDMIQNMNNMSFQKTYTLTDDAKSILSKFMYVPHNGINWNNITEEIYDRPYYAGGEHILFGVRGLSAIKFLRQMYKSSFEDTKSNIEYEIKILGPMNEEKNYNRNDNRYRKKEENFIIDINQLNATKALEIANELGVVPQVGSIRIIKA